METMTRATELQVAVLQALFHERVTTIYGAAPAFPEERPLLETMLHYAGLEGAAARIVRAFERADALSDCVDASYVLLNWESLGGAA